MSDFEGMSYRKLCTALRKSIIRANMDPRRLPPDLLVAYGSKIGFVILDDEGNLDVLETCGAILDAMDGVVIPEAMPLSEWLSSLRVDRYRCPVQLTRAIDRNGKAGAVDYSWAKTDLEGGFLGLAELLWIRKTQWERCGLGVFSIIVLVEHYRDQKSPFDVLRRKWRALPASIRAGWEKELIWGPGDRKRTNMGSLEPITTQYPSEPTPRGAEMVIDGRGMEKKAMREWLLRRFPDTGDLRMALDDVGLKLTVSDYIAWNRSPLQVCHAVAGRLMRDGYAEPFVKKYGTIRRVL